MLGQAELGVYSDKQTGGAVTELCRIGDNLNATRKPARGWKCGDGMRRCLRLIINVGGEVDMDGAAECAVVNVRIFSKL